MTPNIDRPEFPSNLLRLSKKVLASTAGTQYPVKQTFLLSPTPSEESFRTDSPVLPLFYRRDPLTTTNASDTSVNLLSTSTGGTQENDRVTWRFAATRMSDILPDDMDLYAEAEPHIQRESTETHVRQHQFLTEQELAFGPEVKTRLPTINEDEFPYYPLSSRFSPPTAPVHKEAKPDLNDDAKPLVRRGVRGMGLKEYLKWVFRNYGIRAGKTNVTYIPS